MANFFKRKGGFIQFIQFVQSLSLSFRGSGDFYIVYQQNDIGCGMLSLIMSSNASIEVPLMEEQKRFDNLRVQVHFAYTPVIPTPAYAGLESFYLD